MSNEMMVFKNNELGSVRTIMIDGQPWFVGKDVAENLGYRNGSRDINRHVDPDDRIKVMIFDGNQDKETIIINESGLYSLILSSKLESAKKFKQWVTSEILPSIRKHGAYITEELHEKLKNSEVRIEELLEKLAAERRHSKEIEYKSAIAMEKQKNFIIELNPKADYCDDVLLGERLMSVTQISKDYGMSATCFNTILKAFGVQYKLKREELWVLTAKYHDMGYAKTVTIRLGCSNNFKQYTYWTEKGRKFIYDFLKDQGILPKSEQLLQESLE